LARAADQFRRSDVTLWGIVAAIASGVALLSASVATLVPAQLFAGLHESRMVDPRGARIEAQLAELAGARAELAGWRATAAELQNANTTLASRFDQLVEQTAGVRARVGALEGALPRLVEDLPQRSELAPPLVTGSIGATQPEMVETTVRDADGGTMRLRLTPLAPTSDTDQPMPSLLAPSPMMPPSPLLPTVNRPAEASPVAAASPPPPVDEPADVASRPVLAPPSPATATRTIPASRPADDTAGPPSSGATSPATIAAGGSGGVALAKTTSVTPPPSTRPAQAAGALSGEIASVAAPPARVSPANVRAIGVAVGPAVQPAGALSAWEGLAAKIGVLLVGTSPLLANDPAGSTGKVLVAGPIASIAAATTLCGKIDRAGIACTPMPYVGVELAASSPGTTALP